MNKTFLLSSQYLGLAKKKKRIIRPSDKFKFAFDWEAGEDTSRDLNPIYNNPHEAQLLFGRGLKAGIDVRIQKKVRELPRRFAFDCYWSLHSVGVACLGVQRGFVLAGSVWFLAPASRTDF